MALVIAVSLYVYGHGVIVARIVPEPSHRLSIKPKAKFMVDACCHVDLVAIGQSDAPAPPTDDDVQHYSQALLAENGTEQLLFTIAAAPSGSELFSDDEDATPSPPSLRPSVGVVEMIHTIRSAFGEALKVLMSVP